MGLRLDFTTEQIKDALDACDGHAGEAAKYLNELHEPDNRVTRQNVAYWASQMNDDGVTAQTTVSRLAQQNRTLQISNNSERKVARDLSASLGTRDAFMQGLANLIDDLQAAPRPELPSTKDANGKGVTIELLFSDLQIGKLMDDYNSDVAVRRVAEYTEVVCDRIMKYEEQGYTVNKIVLAVLGDIIESDKKHPNSARATDTGTAEQMRHSAKLLWGLVSMLSEFLVPVDVVMITGNHDHDDHGLNMFMPGKEHLSWPLYKSIEMISDASGLGKQVQFFIPEGSFHVHEICGHKVLYEHGVGVAASQAGLSKHLASRMAQRKEFITYFRMGDKHNVCRFNNDTLVVNGAFFGDSRNGEEYSGIAGYDGYPAQLMFAHVARTDNSRTSLFDSLSIQLGHIK